MSLELELLNGIKLLVCCSDSVLSERPLEVTYVGSEDLGLANSFEVP